MSTDVPITLTSKTSVPGVVGAVGNINDLQAAYDAGTQVTLSGGPLAGERVYLGHTTQTYDDGIVLKRTGLDVVRGESPKFNCTIAVFLVDMKRLDDAPQLAELKRKADNAAIDNAMRAQARADEEEARLSREAD